MITQDMNVAPKALEPTNEYKSDVGGVVVTRLSYFRLPPVPAMLAESCRIAFAEQNRAVWDTPAEDRAWQWLQPDQ